MAFWSKWFEEKKFSLDEIEVQNTLQKFEDGVDNLLGLPVAEPEPVLTFKIGLACPQKHARELPCGYHKRSEFPTICEECGGVCKPAVVTAVFYAGYHSYSWKNHEFVRWLKKPTVK